MYSMIVDKDTLHLEVGLLAILLILKLDECILKTVTCPFVADYFA